MPKHHQPENLIDEWFGALNSSPLLPEQRPVVIARVTMLTLSLSLLFLLVWAGVTHIREVASSPGQVMPSGHVQVIQHLEGGMVSAILVREGDVVQPGQILMKLDPTSATSDLNQLKQQQLALSMEMERNKAIMENRTPDFSSFEGVTRDMVEEQERAFGSRMQARGEETKVAQAQLAQRRDALKSLQAQANSIRDNLAIASESLRIKKDLYEKGYYSRLSYLDKQEEMNSNQGRYAAIQQDIERTRGEITEYESRLASLGTSDREKAYQEYNRLQNEQKKNSEAMAKYDDRVARLEVRAPMRGIVKGVEVTTVGGIATPGAKLMEIVPLDNALNVEARIRPSDVGALRPGLPVRVRVQAFDYTRFGTVEGELNTISATTFVDESTGQSYYKGIIRLKQDHVGTRATQNLLVPGMTVDADIITGERSLLAYLLKPIRSAAQTAFTER
jgi:HlyD family secretion protein/adhesin transport system membrane fusion protein